MEKSTNSLTDQIGNTAYIELNSNHLDNAEIHCLKIGNTAYLLTYTVMNRLIILLLIFEV